MMRFSNNQQPLKRNSQVGNKFININFRLFTEKKNHLHSLWADSSRGKKKIWFAISLFQRMHVSSNNFSLIISAISAVKNLWSWGQGSETFDFRLFSPKFSQAKFIQEDNKITLYREDKFHHNTMSRNLCLFGYIN